MQVRGLVVFLTGLLLAGGSVVIAYQTLQNSNNPPGQAEAQPVSTVVIARGEIQFGAPIEPQMVELLPWPEEHIPPGAFLTLEELLGEGNKEPRRARRAMVQGEPIVVSKVSNFGEKVTFSHMLDPNKRAMAIRVDDVSGVGGFVTPGDRVDVVMTRQKGKDSFEALTFLEDITVRGTDQIADEDRDKPNVVRTVTVEVTPNQAQKLAVAQQAGRLSLTLRNISNAVEAGTDEWQPLQPMDLNKLLNKPKAERQPASATPSIWMYRNGERVKVAVPAG